MYASETTLARDCLPVGPRNGPTRGNRLLAPSADWKTRPLSVTVKLPLTGGSPRAER